MKPLYFTGYDIGSEFVHSVTIDGDNKIISSPKSRMHFGNPVATIKEIIKENKKKGISEKNSVFAFTGSGGSVFSEVTKADFFYDSLTIPIGAHLLSKDAKYIFYIGSKDPYFFEKSSSGEYKVFVPDFGTGTKCGGGSGILLNKQCRRLFSQEVDSKLGAQEAMEKMYKLAYESALKADKEIDVGGRCGVVIQSDMIHLQNCGESIPNILRGLFERVAKNYKVDVIRIRHLDKNAKAIITGGVANNDYIVKMLDKNTGLKIERPLYFEKVSAIGAALRLKDKINSTSDIENSYNSQIFALRGKASKVENSKNAKLKFRSLENIDKVTKLQKKNIQYAPALSKFLYLVKTYPEIDSKKFGNLQIFYFGELNFNLKVGDAKAFNSPNSQIKSIYKYNNKIDKCFLFPNPRQTAPFKVQYKSEGFGDDTEDKKIPVVIGIDGGSTTTKAFILREDNLEPVCAICIETHGRPLQAAQKIFKEISNYYKDRFEIKAVAYTGSSGAFYYKLFTKPGKIEECTDLIVDEITCHGLGVKKFNKNVDTIFELGGQDAKFTLFSKDGIVKKAKMNLSCMAGTGQTMQNMVKMIGLDFDEFERLALKAKRTPIVDDTCGVFTEAGISNLVSLGLPKEEVAAAIAYGFIGGYINKFVRNEKFGEFISAQGGPFRNLACLAALASHTKREINAFPHRQLFGAYGAALAAHMRLKEDK